MGAFSWRDYYCSLASPRKLVVVRVWRQTFATSNEITSNLRYLIDAASAMLQDVMTEAFSPVDHDEFRHMCDTGQ